MGGCVGIRAVTSVTAAQAPWVTEGPALALLASSLGHLGTLRLVPRHCSLMLLASWLLPRACLLSPLASALTLRAVMRGPVGAVGPPHPGRFLSRSLSRLVHRLPHLLEAPSCQAPGSSSGRTGLVGAPITA